MKIKDNCYSGYKHFQWLTYLYYGMNEVLYTFFFIVVLGKRKFLLFCVFLLKNDDGDANYVSFYSFIEIKALN